MCYRLGELPWPIHAIQCYRGCRAGKDRSFEVETEEFGPESAGSYWVGNPVRPWTNPPGTPAHTGPRDGGS